ncbi:hypothetical protein PWT90_02595 [Aphanocladium album]|nr:hypothetical protein PWT90_02595 [Aphanocladium album]
MLDAMTQSTDLPDEIASKEGARHDVTNHSATEVCSLDFTPRQARRALLKVDLAILPFMILCFCFLQFDRANIGNALTDDTAKDIAANNSDINLA